ncbi:MAG: hypothetical protein QNI98_00800 [Woeseiaceae bacterium]|nr:hypothetical protein [Woeseiaceae bacterium]
MSMDLILYTACAIALPADLPQAESWKNYGYEDWAYESEGWQVLVAIDAEYEIPSGATDLNTDLRYSIPVTLEPIGADRDGYKFLDTTVRKLADKCGGGVVEGPDGFKRVEVSRPD